jgi:predicted glycosyltransferase
MQGDQSMPLAFFPPAATVGRGKYRIAMYSHDTVGLGHIRRNLLIAQALGGSSLQAEILLVCGSREAGAFVLPPGVDCLTLPAVHKDRDGQYRARHLPRTLPDLIKLRSSIIQATLEAFEPDLLITDNVPRGVGRELDPVLEMLRSNGHTKCVLGLRDVLDDPAVVYREWMCAGNTEAIRDFYDAVWVYGDPAVYDLVREYGFPRDVASKVRFVGYLDQRCRLEENEWKNRNAFDELGLPPGRLVACLLGGGQDGVHVAEEFLEVEYPENTNAVLVTGPLMDRDARARLRRRAGKHARLRVLESVADASFLIKSADQVIAMGGYNTICEVLSWEKRALIVPRVAPRQEQWIRAMRLSTLGLIDVLRPDEFNPESLNRWLKSAVGAVPSAREKLDMNALSRLPILAREMLSDRVPMPWGTNERGMRHAAQ